MTEEQIFFKIREVLVEYLGLEESAIKRDSSLRDDLGASSIELAELAIELEKEMDATIEFEELGDTATVDDLVRLILPKVDS